jgi:hypothetical protein
MLFLAGWDVSDRLTRGQDLPRTAQARCGEGHPPQRRLGRIEYRQVIR